MPSPSSQNFRSAPQKQPNPKIAVSNPAGYGPFSGLPLTKCVAAVRIGLDRPDNASALDGMSSDFLNMNIVRSPELDAAYIGRIGAFGTPSGVTIQPFRVTTPSRTRERGAPCFPSAPNDLCCGRLDVRGEAL